MRPETRVRKMLYHLLMEDRPVTNEERDYLLQSIKLSEIRALISEVL